MGAAGILASAVWTKFGPALIKVGIGLAVLAALGIGLWWFIHHERELGAAQCQAEVKAATLAEQTRQQQVNAKAQEWADRMVRLAFEGKQTNDALVRKIAAMSAGNRGVCLPIDIVKQLRAIGGAGGQTDPVASPSSTKR